MMAFYDHRGSAEQYNKEGERAIKTDRLSNSKFRNNEARLQPHALAYIRGNCMRTLAFPKAAKQRPEARNTGRKPRYGISW